MISTGDYGGENADVAWFMLTQTEAQTGAVLLLAEASITKELVNITQTLP